MLGAVALTAVVGTVLLVDNDKIEVPIKPQDIDHLSATDAAAAAIKGDYYEAFKFGLEALKLGDWASKPLTMKKSYTNLNKNTNLEEINDQLNLDMKHHQKHVTMSKKLKIKDALLLKAPLLHTYYNNHIKKI